MPAQLKDRTMTRHFNQSVNTLVSITSDSATLEQTAR